MSTKTVLASDEKNQLVKAVAKSAEDLQRAVVPLLSNIKTRDALLACAGHQNPPAKPVSPLMTLGYVSSIRRDGERRASGKESAERARMTPDYGFISLALMGMNPYRIDGGGDWKALDL